MKNHIYFKKIRYIAYLTLLLPLLSGCLRFSLDTLENTETIGDAFTRALIQEYRQFAKSEAAQYDWWDAEHFASKGLELARGNPVEPETLENWDIPETMLEPLVKARAKLLANVNGSVKAQQPTMAARAYLLFDCWIEQQEENWQLEHIESCRNEFFEVLDFLSVSTNGIASMPVSQQTPFSDDDSDEIDPSSFEMVTEGGTPPPTSAPTTKTKDIKASSYAIFFDFDSTIINGEAKDVVEKVVEELKDTENYEIILHGYADRAGNEKYNLKLSRIRAENVKKALIRKHINEKYISLFAFGETNLHVATKDGAKEKANRRVEIFIH